MNARSGRFEQLEAESPFPGIVRRALTTAEATVTEYRFQPGATFPNHHHPQEQTALILDGEVHLTAAGETQTLAAGAWSVVAGGVPHGITSGDAGARFLVVLVPPREPGAAYTLAGSPTAPEPSS
jgi:quercetin dioxygenase-like cupin family protein